MDQTLENGDDAASRAAWGIGRVAFLANLEAIRVEVQAGWPLASIYRKYQDSLSGLSYSQFTHHVRKYIQNNPPVKKESLPKPLSQERQFKKKEPLTRLNDATELNPEDIY